MTKVYLIRHAFTPANNASYNNQEGLWQIALDKDMPIEREYGIKQAIELGVFLKDLKGNLLIIASPYLRVLETLNYVLEKMNGNYEIRVSSSLKEFNSGVHYAHTIDEVLRMYPESKKYFEDAEEDLDNAIYTGGESRNQVKKRVKDIALDIESLALEDKYDYILVFAHGMVNYYLNFWLTGEVIDHKMRNCEVYSVSDGKCLFVPETVVPKGFFVNIDDYNDINKVKLLK